MVVAGRVTGALPGQVLISRSRVDPLSISRKAAALTVLVPPPSPNFVVHAVESVGVPHLLPGDSGGMIYFSLDAAPRTSNAEVFFDL